MLKNIRRLVSAIALTATCGFCVQANAAPIAFDITSVSFTPGAGYGVDRKGEKKQDSPTLLDVVFDNKKFNSQSFLLNGIGDFHSFIFGTVFLRDEFIEEAEADKTNGRLDVIAKMTFTNPFGNTIELSAKGTATEGAVSDSQVDFEIVWAPLFYEFGDGGELEIVLNKLSFTSKETGPLTQDQWATVALRASPRDATNNVPEPASLALVGMALLGLGVARRRRR